MLTSESQSHRRVAPDLRDRRTEPLVGFRHVRGHSELKPVVDRSGARLPRQFVGTEGLHRELLEAALELRPEVGNHRRDVAIADTLRRGDGIQLRRVRLGCSDVPTGERLVPECVKVDPGLRRRQRGRP